MFRVTDAEVRAIKPSSLADITPFIEVANIVTDDVAKFNENLGEPTLKMVELFLSAHYLCGVDQEVKAETIEGWKVEYKQQTYGEGILSTSFGNTANQLSGGYFTGIGQKRATIEFFGG